MSARPAAPCVRAPRAVLGLDAAWTPHGTSGVALLRETPDGAWACVAVAPGYDEFAGAAPGAPGAPAGAPLPERLLDAAARYLAAGRPPRAPGGNPPADVTLVTVDLPVALGPVTRRREADDAVSRAFARAKCGTHSPTATRPGPLADRMRAGLAALGFALATAATAAGTARHLVEVYPHPALLALCAREVRLPYKVAKARAYWPSLTRAERAECLAKQYAHIAAALAAAGVRDIPDELRTPEVPATPGRLKPVEDQIDALVCAWVGVEYLRGRARAYGDSEAAIWIPARR